MEVAQSVAPTAAGAVSSEAAMDTETNANDTPASEGTQGSNAMHDRTLKDIISGMKKRRGAKPTPSSLQRAAERRKRRRRQREGSPDEEPTEETVTRVATPSPAEEPQPEEEKEDEVVAPQVTLDEDGNIIIDQASLVVSAGTTTNPEAERGNVTMVENHAYSNHVTSATYAKRESAMKWNAEENERFYAALRRFGTDFSLMQGEFPKRSRRQLKLKFKREEKEFPERIDAALNGPKLPLPPPRETVRANEDAEAERGAVVVEDENDDTGQNKDKDADVAEEAVDKEVDLPTGEEQPTVVEEAPLDAPAANSKVDESKGAEGEKNDGNEDDDEGDRWSDSDDSADG